MKKVLFIDRDGTLIVEPLISEQIDAWEKLEFLPGVFTWLGKIVRELDYELVMVTNQDGLGTPSFPEETFWPVQNFLMNSFKGEGILFREVLIDRSFLHEQKPTRKPGVAMMKSYFGGDYDLTGSYVIGDRATDVLLASNLGAGAILLGCKKDVLIPGTTAALTATGWEEIYHFLRSRERQCIHSRKTRETDIVVDLTLDATGISDISTGLHFFDHMLEQVTRHSRIDLMLKATGDLHVDEHHTIEDTGIAFGEAFSKALGNKAGIGRYGFTLPMDDCLAQVAVDFGGRSWIVWNVDFKRERIGDVPTEMFFHFFRSFSDAARCNLNIKAEGSNEHHKIESVFKAFAKAIRMAIGRDLNISAVPSTKGVL